MLKKVIFSLHEKHYIHIDILGESLLQNGIYFQLCLENEISINKEMLLVTDNSQLCAEISAKGNYVIAYLTEENKGENFADALYAIESLENLDASYFLFVYDRYEGNPLTILETQRCIVREITVDDVEALYDIYKEPSITAYMEKLMDDIEEEKNYTKEYIKNIYGFYGYGIWIVIDKESGAIIGRAGLEHREVTGGVELGFVIARPFQRKGYAYEVCKAILEYAKEIWELNDIYAYVRQENKPSIVLCEKLGFEYRGMKIISNKEFCEYKTPDFQLDVTPIS